MPDPSRFPPEFPSAGPEYVPNVAPACALDHLRRAIDALYLAWIESEQDERSHGPNPKKNRATLTNRFRLIGAAADLIEFLRTSPVAVDREPTATNQRALMKQEKRVTALIERFDDPPTRHQP